MPVAVGGPERQRRGERDVVQTVAAAARFSAPMICLPCLPRTPEPPLSALVMRLSRRLSPSTRRLPQVLVALHLLGGELPDRRRLRAGQRRDRARVVCSWPSACRLIVDRDHRAQAVDLADRRQPSARCACGCGGRWAESPSRRRRPAAARPSDLRLDAGLDRLDLPRDGFCVVLARLASTRWSAAIRRAQCGAPVRGPDRRAVRAEALTRPPRRGPRRTSPSDSSTASPSSLASQSSRRALRRLSMSSSASSASSAPMLRASSPLSSDSSHLVDRHSASISSPSYSKFRFHLPCDPPRSALAAVLCLRLSRPSCRVAGLVALRLAKLSRSSGAARTPCVVVVVGVLSTKVIRAIWLASSSTA